MEERMLQLQVGSGFHTYITYNCRTPRFLPPVPGAVTQKLSATFGQLWTWLAAARSVLRGVDRVCYSCGWVQASVLVAAPGGRRKVGGNGVWRKRERKKCGLHRSPKPINSHASPNNSHPCTSLLPG